jgi:hypothetical protein
VTTVTEPPSLLARIPGEVRVLRFQSMHSDVVTDTITHSVIVGLLAGVAILAAILHIPASPSRGYK